MIFPPSFLDELRNRISITEVVGRKVIWDPRKSNQAKGDMWAPCPFHQEKTASFHVDDRKGFYYCFGCHAKGNVFKFVQETENVNFVEAVELLARSAGMQMPARDPRAIERLDHESRLARVTEAAVKHFRLNLKTQTAADARAYLTQRGLDQTILDRFEIGFAPSLRNNTLQALQDKGFDAEDIITAGLATKPDDGRAPYDAFRDRIVFPIRDGRGRCIGFGARAMDPATPAKYLNSRETPLFDKGRALYNHGPAREAAGKQHPLIVAEGYMDVIALVKAGFEAAVAPLGTAITEAQLDLMWRIADEPIITLDGDTAGQRAAMRLVDLALPLLQPGKTLRFCIMPNGLDPDDLIRARGADAMRAQIEGAKPLVHLLWRRETEGQVFDSPERRAALDQRLRRAIGRIPDSGLRRHYGDALADLRRTLFRPHHTAHRRPWHNTRGFAEAQTPLERTRASAVASGAFDRDTLRVALIIATLYRYPELLPMFEADLERLTPNTPEQTHLIDHLLKTQAADETELLHQTDDHHLISALDRLRGMAYLRIFPFLTGDPAPETAATCLRDEFAKLSAAAALRHELTEALEDIKDIGNGDAHLNQRMNETIMKKHATNKPRFVTGDAPFEDTDEARTAFRKLIETATNEKKNR